MFGAVESRALLTPEKGWVAGTGLVQIIGERSLNGHVFEREVVAANGERSWISAGQVSRYEDAGNILGFTPRPRDVQQVAMDL